KEPEYNSTNKEEDHFILHGNGLNGKSRAAKKNILTNLAGEETDVLYESYKTIFYNSPIPYWIYDQVSLQIIEVNEAAVINYGYTREEFLNLSILDLRPKNEIPLLKQYLRKYPGD